MQVLLSLINVQIQRQDELSSYPTLISLLLLRNFFIVLVSSIIPKLKVKECSLYIADLLYVFMCKSHKLPGEANFNHFMYVVNQ